MNFDLFQTMTCFKAERSSFRLGFQRQLAVMAGLLLIGALLLPGCHRSPTAEKVDYDADQVAKIEKALADYDWSDFEP